MTSNKPPRALVPESPHRTGVLPLLSRAWSWLGLSSLHSLPGAKCYSLLPSSQRQKPPPQGFPGVFGWCRGDDGSVTGAET